MFKKKNERREEGNDVDAHVTVTRRPLHVNAVSLKCFGHMSRGSYTNRPPLQEPSFAPTN